MIYAISASAGSLPEIREMGHLMESSPPYLWSLHLFGSASCSINTFSRLTVLLLSLNLAQQNFLTSVDWIIPGLFSHSVFNSHIQAVISSFKSVASSKCILLFMQLMKTHVGENSIKFPIMFLEQMSFAPLPNSIFVSKTCRKNCL